MFCLLCTFFSLLFINVKQQNYKWYQKQQETTSKHECGEQRKRTELVQLEKRKERKLEIFKITTIIYSYL